MMLRPRPLSRSPKAIELRRRRSERTEWIDELASEWRGRVGEDGWEDVIEDVETLAALDADFQRVTGTRRTPIRDMVMEYALDVAEDAVEGPKISLAGRVVEPAPLPTEAVLDYLFGPPGSPMRTPLDAALAGRRPLSRYAERPRNLVTRKTRE
jgi:hypothetical protein